MRWIDRLLAWRLWDETLSVRLRGRQCSSMAIYTFYFTRTLQFQEPTLQFTLVCFTFVFLQLQQLQQQLEKLRKAKSSGWLLKTFSYNSIVTAINISLIHVQYQILQSARYKNITHTLIVFLSFFSFYNTETSVNAAALNPQLSDLRPVWPRLNRLSLRRPAAGRKNCLCPLNIWTLNATNSFICPAEWSFRYWINKRKTWTFVFGVLKVSVE